jgi:diguanylate cyclase (GGDEF)-like protein
VRGVATMGMATLTLALGILLFGARDSLPSWISFAVANTFIFTGMTLQYRAYAQLFERNSHDRWLLVATVAAVAVYLFFYLIQDSLLARVLTYAAFSSLMIGAVLAVLAKVPRGQRRLGWWLAVVTPAVYLLLSWARTWRVAFPSDLANPTANTLQTWPDIVNVLHGIWAVIWMVFSVTGFILLVSARTQKMLHDLAYKDALTGLRNRRAFLDAISRIPPGASDGWLAIADLDHFKRINDQYGHPAGDAVLVDFAIRLAALQDDGQIVGRLGGEEFGLLLRAESPQAAMLLAQRLQSQVAGIAVTWNGQQIPLTVSIGLARFKSDQMDASFANADQALYQAKELRNCVRMGAV